MRQIYGHCKSKFYGQNNFRYIHESACVSKCVRELLSPTWMEMLTKNLRKLIWKKRVGKLARWNLKNYAILFHIFRHH